MGYKAGCRRGFSPLLDEWKIAEDTIFVLTPDLNKYVL